MKKKRDPQDETKKSPFLVEIDIYIQCVCVCVCVSIYIYIYIYIYIFCSLPYIRLYADYYQGQRIIAV
jgi:hypothetical protein